MAFTKFFLNFNIAQPNYNFNLNFGCFSMPKFFSFSPFFNCGGWRQMPFFNRYLGATYLTPPSVFNVSNNLPYPTVSTCSSFDNFYSNTKDCYTSFNNSCSNITNSWQNVTTSLPNFDTVTFSNTTTVSTSKVKTAKVESVPVSKVKTSKPKVSVNSGKDFKYSSTTDINATQNAKYLQDLDPEMQERTKKLIAYANEKGYDVQITSGYRTQEKQKELQEKYKNEPGRVAKNSAHCSGKAIDIKVTKNGQESGSGYRMLGEYAKSELGMRWGGDFTSYRERWHFDYNWA